MKALVFCLLIQSIAFSADFFLAGKTIELVDKDGKPVSYISLVRKVNVDEFKYVSIIPFGTVGLMYPDFRYEQQIQKFDFHQLEHAANIVELPEVNKQENLVDYYQGPVNTEVFIGMRGFCGRNLEKISVDFYVETKDGEVSCAQALSHVDQSLEDAQSSYESLPDHIVCKAKKSAEEIDAESMQFLRRITGPEC